MVQSVGPEVASPRGLVGRFQCPAVARKGVLSRNPRKGLGIRVQRLHTFGENPVVANEILEGSGDEGEGSAAFRFDLDHFRRRFRSPRPTPSQSEVASCSRRRRRAIWSDVKSFCDLLLSRGVNTYAPQLETGVGSGCPTRRALTRCR